MLHLLWSCICFFARIMKEHALFLEAGFTPVNASFAGEADRLKV